MDTTERQVARCRRCRVVEFFSCAFLAVLALVLWTRQKDVPTNGNFQAWQWLLGGETDDEELTCFDREALQRAVRERHTVLPCVQAGTDGSRLFQDIRYSRMSYNVSGWNMTGVTNLAYAWANSSVTGWQEWDVSAVTNLTGAFQGYRHSSVDVGEWQTAAVQSLKDTFRDLYTVPVVGVEGWNVSSVTDLEGTFREAWVVDPDLSLWDVAAVTSLHGTFAESWNFRGQGLDGWQVGRVTDMMNTFRDSRSLQGDLSSWDTSHVTNMAWMLSGAEVFDGDLSKWNVSSVEDMEYMFFRAFNFTDGGIGSWDMSSVTSIAGMFRSSPFAADLNAWDVSNVWNMLETFRSTPFPGSVSNWTVVKASTARYMFADTSTFDDDLSLWNLSSLLDATGMFSNAAAFLGRGLDTWRLNTIHSMASMFLGAGSFDQDLCEWPLYGNTTNMFTETGCNYTDDPSSISACHLCM